MNVSRIDDVDVVQNNNIALSSSSSPMDDTCDETTMSLNHSNVNCNRRNMIENSTYEDSRVVLALPSTTETTNKEDNRTIASSSSIKSGLFCGKEQPTAVEVVGPTVPSNDSKCEVDDIDNGDDNDDEDDGRIRLGICAMDKKARSKPMAEILSRIDDNTYRVVFFGDTVLLNDDPNQWPICDVLIAFYSKGYPLYKVKEYVIIRKPYILNDLDMQEVIQDRRRVYDTLEGSGIDVPRHVYLSRDGYKSTGSGDGNGDYDQEVVEYDDHIVVNGITIHKPFVEKPVNAENHNISIYYPTTAGGGCKKLFRKIGNRSSEFYPNINEVRRDGSYIYEEFVETQGTDVKMYTVGPGNVYICKCKYVNCTIKRNKSQPPLLLWINVQI
jgi:Diphosphoinositol pentakisphosphate kinase 2 N-terminal domain